MTNLTWSKDILIKLGTNIVKVSTADKAGKTSDVKQKIIVGQKAISIDGNNDFDVNTEKLETTSSGYYTYNLLEFEQHLSRIRGRGCRIGKRQEMDTDIYIDEYQRCGRTARRALRNTKTVSAV